MSHPRPSDHSTSNRPLAFICILALVITVWAMPAVAGPDEQAADQATAESDSGMDLSSALRLVFAEPKPTAEELPDLLQQVKQHPDDTETRLRLISYYRPFQSQERRSWEAHLRWLLEKHPEEAGTAQLTRSLAALPHDEVMELTKRLWLEQVERYPDDPRVQANAATFFSLHDRELAEELLEKAKALEPKNPQWSRQLAQIFQHSGTGGDTVEAARRALAELESAVPNMSEDERQATLPQLAKYAYDAGADKKARSYAQEMIELAGGEAHWNTGNLFHHGHIVLGRLDLKGDNLDGAKTHLLDAARTDGSPQLNSFGPNMSLAKELLDRDQRDVVLEYLALCGKFWSHGEDRLKGWQAQIQAGGMPNFGPNLIF